MGSLVIALILSGRASTRAAQSALPDAPTLPHVDEVARLLGFRGGLAIGLRRLADLVSPPEHAVRVSTGRLALSAGNGTGVAPWNESPGRTSPSR